MRGFILAFSLIVATAAGALEVEDRRSFGPADGAVIRVLSTADTGFFEPMIASFLADRPGVAVEYTVASSTEVARAVAGGEAFDVVISSAMDLQTKLANDGYAARHSSDATGALPGWAGWNDMLFAFTQEPAAIVVSRAAFDGNVPESRQALIDLLRQDPERFRGRVGTYDVTQSGLGYLFATQDARASDTFWRLAEVMGALDARLYCCSSDMIEAVRTGELLIAYNVLGSYVANRPDRDAFEIVLPSDFTTVMLRTAFIPVNAPSPDLSRGFVDHVLVQSFGDAPLFDAAADLGQIETSVNRIRIGPALMVFLDQLKRRAFLAEWEAAIRQGG